MKSRVWLLVGMLIGYLGLSATQARAQDDDFTVVATNLYSACGLTASALGDSDTLYFMEVPQAAEQGLGTNSSNTVSQLTLSTSTIGVLNRGDPQPTNVVQDAGGASSRC